MFCLERQMHGILRHIQEKWPLCRDIFHMLFHPLRQDIGQIILLGIAGKMMKIEWAKVRRRMSVIVSSNIHVESKIFGQITLSPEVPFTDGSSLIAGSFQLLR